jgi:hypothetical protein
MKLEETWLGLGVKSDGQLLVGGVESITGMLFNLGNVSDRHTFEMTSSRWGLGLGGSIGVTAVFVFDLKGVMWLDGQEITGGGLTVSYGDKFGNLSQYLNDIKFFTGAKLVAKDAAGPATWLPVFQQAGAAVDNATKKAVGPKHRIIFLDIPFGGVGLELSVVDTKGTLFIDP